jgi:hypothetical protein
MVGTFPAHDRSPPPATSDRCSAMLASPAGEDVTSKPAPKSSVPTRRSTSESDSWTMRVPMGRFVGTFERICSTRQGAPPEGTEM